ncbi:MAG TPA: PQQ-binding-like beta-propeller repeat protein, partial [Ktedonobacteraceae bacterium]|nr:PQQ-binding-like beta-propeller repeat protein [Ktedonobacteraceae bacterium]
MNQNNSGSRPSNPPIRRDTATTPITLPRRRYTSNSAHIRPEFHPRDISVNKDTNLPQIQSNLDEGEATQKLGPASEETAVKDTNTKIDPDTNPTAQVIDADSAEIKRVTDPTITNAQTTSEITTDPAALTITPVTTSKTSLQANSAEEPVQTQSPIRTRLRRFHIQPLRLFNHVLALLLVGLACFSVVELVLDMTSSHLIVSSINPESGVIQSRQDSGTRLAADTQITTPTQLPGGLFFATQDGRQNQLYRLHGGTLTPLDHEIQTMTATPGILTTTPDGNLLVTSQTGVSLLTPTGKQIWSITGSQPTSGAHTFQPAFDQKNMYTVKSTYANQIAAYSLTSGQERWSQTLSDTLDDAPPFLVDAKQLYVASDHQISALSLNSGKILWKAALPTRTLLMVSGSKPLLLSAGINGLTALDPQKGTILWKASLSPRSSVSASSLTSVQFYQASLNNAGTVVFASGTSWESPAVREHVWLAAFETKTGQNLWSKETAAGFLNADSNRTLPLLVDDQHNLVIQQLQPQPLNRTLRAFDTTSGNQRWQTKVDRVQGTSSSLLQQQDGSFILASTTTDTWQLPASWLIERIGFVVALGLSLLGLGVLAITVWLLDKRSRPQTVPEEQLLAPNEERSKLQTYSPQIAGAVLLLLFIGAGVFAYFELNGTGIINALDMRNGIADRSGNVFVSSGENFNHQITAVDSQGNTRWQNLSSEGQMSVLPDTQSPHSVLVLVRGHLPQGYRYAPTDIAYPNPLESLEILYRFDRQSGALQWQTILNPAGSSTEATILGNDPHQIYIASLGQDTSNKLQLYALEQATGNLLWTITIPHTNHVTSAGSFIGKGSERVWQVDGKTYTID